MSTTPRRRRLADRVTALAAGMAVPSLLDVGYGLAASPERGGTAGSHTGAAADGGGRRPSSPRSAQKPAAKAWLMLPATPALPKADASGTVEVNGTGIFHAVYGAGPAVVMLHGGLGSSNYWGHQISALSPRHRVIAIDTRGHGRSPVTSNAFSYDLFARDVLAIMDRLGVGQAALVGWSDGGVTALQLAMLRPDRVSGAFLFGANADPSGYIPGGASRSSVFRAYVARCNAEYRKLSPTPARLGELTAGLRRMWRSEPRFTRAMLARTKVSVTVAHGAHDEIIRREHASYIASAIPGARLAVLPGVSHFAMLQQPQEFNAALQAFFDGGPAVAGRP
ncbi:MAG: alpha/beta hydrolase [Hyphomicrobiaceae bacterium]